MQTVVNPYAPIVTLAPLSRARASAQINELNGSITSISLDYNGSGYTALPEILIRGDGSGAEATASIDYDSGQLTGVTITDMGYDYTKCRSILYGWL